MGGGDDGGDGTRRPVELAVGSLGKKANESHSTVTQTKPGPAPNKRAVETHPHDREQDLVRMRWNSALEEPVIMILG